MTSTPEQIVDSRTIVQWVDDRYEVRCEARFLSTDGEVVFRATAWGPDMHPTVADAVQQVREMLTAWQAGAPQ